MYINPHQSLVPLTGRVMGLTEAGWVVQDFWAMNLYATLPRPLGRGEPWYAGRPRRSLARIQTHLVRGPAIVSQPPRRPWPFRYLYHVVTLLTSINRADARQAGVFMYIDPTSGSLALQVLAAGALSALAMFSRIREAIKSFFRNLVSHGRRWSGHR
jgi:hypothetical protein